MMEELPREDILACGHCWGFILLVMGVAAIIVDILLINRETTS